MQSLSIKGRLHHSIDPLIAPTCSRVSTVTEGCKEPFTGSMPQICNESGLNHWSARLLQVFSNDSSTGVRMATGITECTCSPSAGCRSYCGMQALI